MEKRYRLLRNSDFQRVRSKGRLWFHDLVVLYVYPNGLQHSRFGFSVSKRIGKAVLRNRLKRCMREAIRHAMRHIPGGWDMVFVARGPIRDADFQQIELAIHALLRRSELWVEPIGGEKNK
ncbi:MAG: ribonuclease P protein component [Chloroflexi bacterium]|nr:ribonuclease P protein component [Chloroflexota bacterium]